MFLFLISMLILPHNSYAVVNGKELNEVLLSSKLFVAVSLNLPGLSAAPCSGTYVGEGQILTASHCLLMNDYPKLKPEICISDSNTDHNINKVTSCFKDSDYEILFPPQVEVGPKAPTRKLRRVISIPKPDLVLVQIRTDLLNSLADFSIMPLAKDSASIINDPNWQLSIVGQGCTAYTEPGAEVPVPGIEVYRFAEVQLSHELTTLIEYFSIWTKENQNAGLCWGDSGGALVAVHRQTNKIVQLAVNSSTKKTYDRSTGYTASVKSIFSRVDQTTTREWLEQTIKSTK